MKCINCKRKVANVETNRDIIQVLKEGETYLKRVPMFKYVNRTYCGHCGQWLK